jgi:hypothetical protein
MNFHNKRDSKGRFAPKDPSSGSTKRPKKTIVQTASNREIYDIVLLDESSSMGGTRGVAAVKGFNRHVQGLIESADKLKIKTLASLYVFNHSIKKTHFLADPNAFPNLDYASASYMPSGSTALYKVVADSINELIAHLSVNNKLDSKDINVTITMFTDGEDTSSHSSLENARKAVNDAMKLGWTIAFIGAGNKRSLEVEASKMGIHHSNVLVVEGTEQGIEAAYDSLTQSRSIKTELYATKGVSSNIGFFQK